MSLNFNFLENNQNNIKKIYENYKEILNEELNNLNKASNLGYNSKYSSINLCDDLQILENSKKLVKKLNDFDIFILIGIGGSNLGTLAIVESIFGNFYNNFSKKKIYFADTIDQDKISDICQIVKKNLIDNKKVILNVISKSGTTLETITNFNILLDILKKNAKYEYKDYVVVTTQKDSKLDVFARNEKFNILNISENVGGRYSVFSYVGIFPLMCFKIDCEKLLLGAKDMKSKCLDLDFDKNVALKSSVFLYDNYLKNKKIFCLFFFSTKLESLGKWCRQLLAESLGKEFSLDLKKKLNSGITPIISIGSVDLHSISQLYLAGPDDKCFCFINTKCAKTIKIPKNQNLEKQLFKFEKKDIKSIFDSIYLGTFDAFINREKSCFQINFENINEYEIGEFMQYKMIQTILVGKLLNVNPFDQPNVEEYKVLVKKYLLKKNKF